MLYAIYSEEDRDSWLKMALALWPDTDLDELVGELRTIVASKNQEIFIAKTEEEERVGFAHVSIRHDYVPGILKAPLGYLEGIFVEPSHRQVGIARKLVELAENWSIDRGCTQMGSDTWTWNQASRDFHSRLGFKEEEILVHFIKNIKQ